MNPRLPFAMVLCLMLGGCSLGEPAPPERPALATAPAPALAHEDAAAALLAGRAQEARALFQRLAAQSDDLLLARRARYGLAAAALAAAQTPAQAQEALALWRAWRKEAPQTPAAEDPRLLGPVVEGLGTCLAAGQRASVDQDQNQRLKAALHRSQEENQRLRRQLAELEALHRELGERKSRLGR